MKKKSAINVKLRNCFPTLEKTILLKADFVQFARSAMLSVFWRLGRKTKKRQMTSKSNGKRITKITSLQRVKNTNDLTLMLIKKYYAANKESVLKNASQWRKKNSARWAMLQSAIRARVSKQTPQWACDNKIREIYLQCDAMRKMGQDVQVDHIVPLNGETVSGFHCEANLQILTASENSRKKNYYWPDMPEERLLA